MRVVVDPDGIAGSSQATEHPLLLNVASARLRVCSLQTVRDDRDQLVLCESQGRDDKILRLTVTRGHRVEDDLARWR